MALEKLLVANRGEVAVRVVRAARDLGLGTVSVYSEDDASSLHVERADEAVALPGRGAAAYLDAERLVSVARDTGCDAVHPGWGFLSESADFAGRCGAAGLVFVGPEPETLEVFGDKGRARDLAERLGVPVLAGTSGPTTLDEARAFYASLGEGASLVVKALAGGGGRGMRVVEDPDALEPAFERCRSEAEKAFGRGDLYVEQRLPRARHVEVQLVGDGTGAVAHLFERECSIQRRHQKLIEVAPAPDLGERVRERLYEAALRLGTETRYRGLGTVEFLVATEALDGAEPLADGFVFIEANARLQVEHTVTECITGLDLVELQLRLADGAKLDELGLSSHERPAPRGFAIQTRVNMETLTADGGVRPTGGTLSTFEVPSGPGVRTDTFGYSGYTPSPGFDSLLAKVIAHSAAPDFALAARKAHRALSEFKIEGIATNLSLLQSVLEHPDFVGARSDTTFIDAHLPALLETANARSSHASLPPASASEPALAGARIDPADPLAVLHHGKSDAEPGGAPASDLPSPTVASPSAGPPGTEAVHAPLQGTIVSVDVAEGDRVYRGQPLLVMESMKMEHVIDAPLSGVVRELAVREGDAVFEGHALAFVEPGEVEAVAGEATEAIDLDRVRPDLAEVVDRHEVGLDARRPEAVARRRKTGQRTTRENVDDLCDPGSFVEYGPLVLAAQRRRRSVEDLIARTPADGMVAGVGTVNTAQFGPEASRCIVMSYDYTVLAGTQGQQNHRKKDRMFELAEQWQLPVVFFTEGGGGRPGDTDGLGVAGLDCLAFNLFGKLSGLVPLVGINSGRCFAGNAALLGCCDVVIATENSNIGMGGPAMIEGGGLGVFRPEDVGPMDVQRRNGVVDVAVADEAEAVEVARRYLSYFQGSLPEWECADQRHLRGVIPENRLRIYDVRRVVETLADTGSVLELRREFGLGMVTALIRIEGRAVGLVANNPTHLAGAIDSDGADKAARFMQLCDAFDVPILFLCDTPGIMVGPEVEKTALVRHAARMFVTGASVSVPFFTIVLRKSYGLGAQAMAGGSFKAPFFAVSWPTGEFGGMGLEGAVKLGYRNELAALEDPEERRQLYEEMVERMYQHGKAVNTASHFELDDVIDPADSRRWIANALRSAPAPERRRGKKRPNIDTW